MGYRDEFLAMSFWVVGGEYTNTSFREVVPGKKEERLGPFATYDQAMEAWSARAWATVDDCNSRYHIVQDEAA